jgi:hypothetical protein
MWVCTQGAVMLTFVACGKNVERRLLTNLLRPLHVGQRRAQSACPTAQTPGLVHSAPTSSFPIPSRAYLSPQIGQRPPLRQYA